jgi:hypothetical protein
MREASVYTGRTRNTTPAAPGRLGNEHHHRDRRAHLDERVRRGYHPRRGGRYDSGEDRSPSPEPRLGNSWDLQSCRQQPGESLRDYIRRFSKQRTELPNITDSDVIGAFLAGTTCRDLVSKLGRKTPTRASELMDIATKFTFSQEAVEAIFRKDKQPQGRTSEDAPEASTQRGAKKKGKKKSQAKRDGADADLVAAAEYKNPWKPPGDAVPLSPGARQAHP